MTQEHTDTERGRRKTRIGFVESDKMEKTIVVSIERRYKHPKYKKYIRDPEAAQGPRREQRGAHRGQGPHRGDAPDLEAEALAAQGDHREGARGVSAVLMCADDPMLYPTSDASERSALAPHP